MVFVKGSSGNPGGKSSKLNSGVLEARKHAEEAILVLSQSLKSPDENIRVKSANSILDRAWGKPKEQIEHTGADGGAIITTSIPSIDSWLGGMLGTAKEIVSKKPVSH